MIINRESIAAMYLRGQGIEIGACAAPLKVLPGCVVKYVDRLPLEELKKHHPDNQNYVPVDIVDDGEALSEVPDSSQDFVIASHVIEHCEDPIKAVGNWIRVLKPGGVLYMIVPDKRYIFDKNRSITPLWHVRLDRLIGPRWHRLTHYLEWVRVIDGKRGLEVWKHARRTQKDGISIHFHVWTQAEIMKLLGYLKKRLPFEVELVTRYGVEVICVLRKI
jgi:ubiquinone/menaquinone biosynthesis C-methylase UbiE